jgi:hypothetical protein
MDNSVDPYGLGPSMPEPPAADSQDPILPPEYAEEGERAGDATFVEPDAPDRDADSSDLDSASGMQEAPGTWSGADDASPQGAEGDAAQLDLGDGDIYAPLDDSGDQGM